MDSRSAVQAGMVPCSGGKSTDASAKARDVDKVNMKSCSE